MQNSLERINPDEAVSNETTGDETLALHLGRYHYAGKNIVPGLVADIACGVGYGSKLLAEHYAANISKIIAVDSDVPAIEFAQKRFNHPLVEFIAADAMNFYSTIPFNNIVSLETIEH